MTWAIARRVVAGAVALVAAGLVGWQVLAPAEVLAPATDGYPVAAVRAPGVTGRTPAAPLIVDGRVRVYAAARQVRADAPVDAKTYGTPRWSFRRWPEQLNGMVAVGSTVVTRWSDGELVALDARNGTIAWRADGPPAVGYDGRRTGAGVAWAPTGLHTAGTIVVVNGGERLVAVDALTGTRRWQVALPRGCAADAGFTTLSRRYVCGTGAYDVPTGQPVPGWPTGAATPLGCDVAASACGGLRDADGRGWLTGGATPQRATTLDVPGSTVAGGLALSSGGAAAGGEVVARSPVTGAEVWRWAPPEAGTVQVLAAQPGTVHLLTAARELVTLDTATGAARSVFPLAVGGERPTWTAGRAQAAAGFLAVERLRTPPAPDADDADYYYSADTVIIAAT